MVWKAVAAEMGVEVAWKADAMEEAMEEAAEMAVEGWVVG